MASKSVGSLNAMLSLSTRDWDAGLSKARKSLETTRARIMKSTGAGSMEDLFGGGGMGAVRASRDLTMRRARESYMGKGTAEQQSWQSSIGSAKAMATQTGMAANYMERYGKALAIAVVASKAIEVSSKTMAGSWKDTYYTVIDTIKELPLLGQAWGMGEAIRNKTGLGFSRGGEPVKGEADKLAMMQQSAADYEKYMSNSMSQMRDYDTFRKRMAGMSSDARDEAGMAGMSDSQRAYQALRIAHRKQLEDLAEQKRQALSEQGAGTYGEIYRPKIEMSYAQARNAMLASQAAEQNALLTKNQEEESSKAREQQWNDRRKLLALDSEIAQAQLRMSGKVAEAEQEQIRTKYQLELEEAYRAGDQETAYRLSQLRDIELAETRPRSGHLADMDFSSKAGTGSIEKTLPTLGAIHRAIKAGVVARAG